jgi:hypothetical protein
VLPPGPAETRGGSGLGAHSGAGDDSPDGFQSLSVLVGTWNMGGRPCPAIELHEWLRPDEFDIYAVGTQECEAAPGLSTATQRPKWLAKLKATLGPEYALIDAHCMGTTHIACFARESLMPYVHDVHAAHVITGLGQRIANKAGVAVCFDVHHTSFLFVNAHFAAHQENVAQRNDDYLRIDTALVPLLCPDAFTNAGGMPRLRGAASPDAASPPGDARAGQFSPATSGAGVGLASAGRNWSVSALFDRVRAPSAVACGRRLRFCIGCLIRSKTPFFVGLTSLSLARRSSGSATSTTA